MAHLHYTSNEMYSSTDLIRKSKTIFNKIISNEIDKAIILRDGKPSFMLLDFKKYEQIMAKYELLEANNITNNDTITNTTNNEKVIKQKSTQVIPPKPVNIEKNEEKKVEGLQVLDDLDFDEEFKKEVARKVKQRESQVNNIEEKISSTQPPLKEYWE